MKPILFLLLLTVCAVRVNSQSILPLRADTILIEKVGGSAFLKLKDSSRNTTGGILTNIGGGVYVGKHPHKSGDTLFIGRDTFLLSSKIFAKSGLSRDVDTLKLGQDVDAVGAPATLNSNREIPMNGFNIGLSGSGWLGVGTHLPRTSFHVNATPTATTDTWGTGLISGGRNSVLYNADFTTSGSCCTVDVNMLAVGNASNNTSQWLFTRARGTNAVPLAVVDGDQIGEVMAGAYTGSTQVLRAGYRFIVDGTPSGSSVPVSFSMYSGTSARTEMMKLTADLKIKMNLLAAPPSTYNVLVHGLTDSATYQVPMSSLTGTPNIANTDLRQTANRTYKGNLFSLTMDSLKTMHQIVRGFGFNGAQRFVQLYLDGITSNEVNDHMIIRSIVRNTANNADSTTQSLRFNLNSGGMLEGTTTFAGFPRYSRYKVNSGIASIEFSDGFEIGLLPTVTSADTLIALDNFNGFRNVNTARKIAVSDLLAGVSDQTWQQTLTANPDITADVFSDGHGHSFTLDNLNDFSLNAIDISTSDQSFHSASGGQAGMGAYTPSTTGQANIFANASTGNPANVIMNSDRDGDNAHTSAFAFSSDGYNIMDITDHSLDRRFSIEQFATDSIVGGRFSAYHTNGVNRFTITDTLFKFERNRSDLANIDFRLINLPRSSSSTDSVLVKDANGRIYSRAQSDIGGGGGGSSDTFALQDNLGIRDRYINMQRKNFVIDSTGELEWWFRDADYNSQIYATKNFMQHSVINLTEGSSSEIANEDSTIFMRAQGRSAPVTGSQFTDFSIEPWLLRIHSQNSLYDTTTKVVVRLPAIISADSITAIDNDTLKAMAISDLSALIGGSSSTWQDVLTNGANLTNSYTSTLSSTKTFKFSGSNPTNAVLEVEETDGENNALLATASSEDGKAATFSSQGGNGVNVVTLSGTGIDVLTNSGKFYHGFAFQLPNNDANNVVEQVEAISALSPVDGFAASKDYLLGTNDGPIDTMARFQVEATSATAATRTGAINLWTKYNNGILTKRFTLKGIGQLSLPEYAGGQFTGTSAYDLAVTTSGDVIQRSTKQTFSQYATGTVTASDAETTLLSTGTGSKIVAPAKWIAGKTYRVHVNGRLSTDASNPCTHTFRLKLGSVTIASTSGLFNTAGTVDRMFEADIYFTCRTTGSSGTVMSNGMIKDDNAAINNFFMGAGTTSTINMTTNQTLDFTIQMSNDDAGNSASIDNFTFEEVNPELN